MARPKKPIDSEQVYKLAEIHCTNEEIASICKCSVDTLERRFADVIKSGKNSAKASLRRLMWSSAKNGSVPMQIWLSKNLLGYADNFEVHSEAAGKFTFVEDDEEDSKSSAG